MVNQSDPTYVPATEHERKWPVLDQPGDRVGPYKLLAMLGEGGFGVVFLADQEEPVRRRVALKILKPGMDSAGVLARFEQEQQALALMDHPNVARVFDAGVTPSGRPYFVMEHVAGEPITAYADRHRLTLRQRLELFVPVCEAVQHAHTKGIIHRDLKANNVLVELVDHKPIPKVIDFGVAKAISQRLTEKTIFTEQGILVGTPEYMSPEQAEMGALDIDTRTDVYSLGVLLYELLTGVLPFEPKQLRSAGYAAIQKIIREVDPPKPSTRLTDLAKPDSEISVQRIAANRGTDLGALARTLKRELEWIPLKAMRKDRGERYTSPSDLAADIGNYLGGRPLRAGPESGWYLARKFVRRHRVGVGVVATIGAVLLGSSAVMAWLLAKTVAAEGRATTSAALARTETQKTKAVSDFVSDMLRSADPGRDGRQVKVADVLDKAGPSIDRAAASQPEVAASMHEVLGSTYQGLGLYEDAAKHFRSSLDLRTRSLGANNPETFQAMANLAPALGALGRSDDARAMLVTAIDGLTAALGPEHRNTLMACASLAKLNHETGRLDEAIQLFREVSDAGLRVLPENDDQLPMWLGTLGVLLTDSGKLDEAKVYADQALERARRTLGREHPTTQYAMNVLARWHQLRGEFEPAEKLYKEAYAAGLKVLGEEHPSTLYWMNNVARILQDQKKFEEAAAMYEKLVAVQTRVVGPEQPDTLMFRSNLARCYQDLKQYDRAEPVMRAVVEAGRRTITLDHVNCMIWQNNLAKLLELKGNPAAAEPLYAEVVASARKNLPETHNVRATFELNWGACLGLLGKFDQAEPLMIGAEKQMAAVLPVGHPQLKSVRARIADFYEKMGRPEQAASWRERTAQ